METLRCLECNFLQIKAEILRRVAKNAIIEKSLNWLARHTRIRKCSPNIRLVCEATAWHCSVYSTWSWTFNTRWTHKTALTLSELQKCVSFIREPCSTKGKTVWFPVIFFPEIAMLADDVGIIDRGVLLEEESLKELEKKNTECSVFRIGCWKGYTKSLMVHLK